MRKKHAVTDNGVMVDGRWASSPSKSIDSAGRKEAEHPNHNKDSNQRWTGTEKSTEC